jgi:hypothetical protein
LKQGLFRQVNDILLKHPRKGLDADVVKEIIILNLPAENFEKIFQTFVDWSQYGNLFAYVEETQKLYFPRKRAPRNPKPKGEGNNGNQETAGAMEPISGDAQAPTPAPPAEPPQPPETTPKS